MMLYNTIAPPQLELQNHQKFKSIFLYCAKVPQVLKGRGEGGLYGAFSYCNFCSLAYIRVITFFSSPDLRRAPEAGKAGSPRVTPSLAESAVSALLTACGGAFYVMGLNVNPPVLRLD